MSCFAAFVLATSSKSTPSGSSAASLIFIVIIGLAAYFLFIRPRSMAARRQRQTLQELVPGEEVLTASGIFGTVLDVESDRVTLETAPGTRLTVLRSTVARRMTPTTTEDEASTWPPAQQDGAAGGEEAVGDTTDGGAEDEAEDENTQPGRGDQGGVG